MEPRDALLAVRARWWLCVIGMVVGLACGGVVTALATPLYSSSTQMFVASGGISNASTAYTGSLFTEQRVASYVELLQSEELGSQVIADVGIDLTPSQLAAEMDVKALPNTVLLQVTVTESSAERAQAIAAAFASRFTTAVDALERPSGSPGPDVEVTVVEPAQLETDPVSPASGRDLAMGLVVGLLAGGALALFLGRGHLGVRTGQQVRALTRTDVIGTVLHDRRLRRQDLAEVLVRQSTDLAGVMRAQTVAELSGGDPPPRVVVVTSAVPGEGRSTTAVHLAAALAKAGRRVVLVDADLRRPQVTRATGLLGAPGLTEVLSGRASLASALRTSRNGRLSVLPAGAMPDAPALVLASPRLGELLRSLAGADGHVVVDVPPLLPVEDAVMMCAKADACLLVIRAGRPEAADVAAAATKLKAAGVPLLGVLLNAAPRAAAHGRRRSSYAPERRRQHSSGTARTGFLEGSRGLGGAAAMVPVGTPSGGVDAR